MFQINHTNLSFFAFIQENIDLRSQMFYYIDMKNHSDDIIIENRKEVFMYNLRKNYFTLFCAGVALMIFALPLIAWLWTRNTLIFDMDNNSSIENIEKIAGIYTAGNLILIPLLLIWSIGIAGILHIIKKLCWEHRTSFWDTFKEGVKSNILQTSITMLIVGLLNFAVGLNYYPLNTSSENYVTILCSICVILPMLLMPTLIFQFAQIEIYNQKYIKLTTISISIYVSGLFKTLGLFLLTMLPYLVLLINNPTAQAILLTVLIIFYLPLQAELYFLYSCAEFDKKLNPTNFPSIIGKGVEQISRTNIDDD